MILSSPLNAISLDSTKWSYELKFLDREMIRTGSIEFKENTVEILYDDGFKASFNYRIQGYILFIDQIGFYIEEYLDSIVLIPAYDSVENYKITIKKSLL